MMWIPLCLYRKRAARITHNIINLSETVNLVTVMWANAPFDPGYPDTYFEKV